MSRPEALLIAYVVLAAAALNWAFRRVNRAPTVRAAVQVLPVALAPLWVVVVLIGYVGGGTLIALGAALVGTATLAGLWVLRFGVDAESSPLVTVDEDAVWASRVGPGLAAKVRLGLLVAMVLGVAFWILQALRA